jgi:hypothetical protein
MILGLSDPNSIGSLLSFIHAILVTILVIMYCSAIEIQFQGNKCRMFILKISKIY